MTHTETPFWQTQVTDYLADYEGLTHQRYAAALRAFHTWYHQTYRQAPDADLLTPEEVREYRNALSQQGLQAATINARLAPVRGVVRAQGRILRVRGVRRTQPAVQALNGRELGRLLAAVDGESWQAQRNVALLTLLAKAGLRVSEALALTLDDVELNARSGTALIRQGKGRQERHVPLNKAVRHALQVYLAVRPTFAPGYVFVSRGYGPLNSRDVQRLIAGAASRAGIPKRVTPHTLRHTFATRFLRQNPGDIATLAHILGHRNVSTTTRYLHPDAEQVQTMMEGV